MTKLNFMGRYSSPLATDLADTANMQHGCDTTCRVQPHTDGVLVDRLGADAVAACDPSPGSSPSCAARHPHVRRIVLHRHAEEVPLADGEFDHAMAQLVLHFVSDPDTAAGEGSAVSCDLAVTSLPAWTSPRAWRCSVRSRMHDLGGPVCCPDEAHTLRYGGPGGIAELFAHAGLDDITESTLQVLQSTYADFDALGRLRGRRRTGRRLLRRSAATPEQGRYVRVHERLGEPAAARAARRRSLHDRHRVDGHSWRVATAERRAVDTLRTCPPRHYCALLVSTLLAMTACSGAGPGSAGADRVTDGHLRGDVGADHGGRDDRAGADRARRVRPAVRRPGRTGRVVEPDQQDRFDDDTVRVDTIEAKTTATRSSRIHSSIVLSINGLDDRTGQAREPNRVLVAEATMANIQIQQADSTSCSPSWAWAELPVDGVSGSVTARRLCAARMALGLPASTADMAAGSDEEQIMMAATPG